MRIQVGKVVNTDQQVNIADLSPLDRIISSTIHAYKNTAMYRRRYSDTEEKRQEQLRRVRESLVESILAVVSVELEQNKSLKSKDDTCKALLLEVPSRFQQFFPDILSIHEFDAYEMHIIKPSQILSKFANPPLMLLVTNRGG